MKLLSWLRFAWDLKTLDATPVPLASHYAIRRAMRNEQEIVRKTIFSAFSLDSDWSDSLNRVWGQIDEGISGAFEGKETRCLVLTHGTRIIGASTLSTNSSDPLQLLSGPCILVEYRNRGLGTALLAASLRFLADAGLDTAIARTKKTVPAAKFVYPKFGGKAEPCDMEPDLVNP